MNHLVTEGSAETEAETDHDRPGSADAEHRDPPALRARRRRWLGVVVALLVIAVGLSAVAVVLFLEERAESGREEDRAAAVAAARQTVINLITTDPIHTRESFDRLSANATGDFAQQLRGQADAFVRAVQGAGVISQGEVAESAVQRFDERGAQVLVVANSQVRNAQVPQGEPRAYRMSVTLDHAGEQWLVSGLDFVP